MCYRRSAVPLAVVIHPEHGQRILEQHQGSDGPHHQGDTPNDILFGWRGCVDCRHRNALISSPPSASIVLPSKVDPSYSLGCVDCSHRNALISSPTSASIILPSKADPSDSLGTGARYIESGLH